MKIWNPQYETMPREELLQLQLERLQATLHRVYRSVAFYRRLFDSIEMLPEQIEALDDLDRLPFTTRDHLREHYPYDMFGIPLREVVRLHTAASAAGVRPVVGYTANDIAVWGELAARVLSAAGVTADDVVQIAFDYGLRTHGFGLHAGAERVGASVVPASSAGMSRQAAIMRDYRATVLIAPPSVAYALEAYLAKEEIAPKSLHLRTAVFSAEPWPETARSGLTARLGVEAADTYGISEIMGPGVAGECGAHEGLHLQEDHFYAEIVDPATGARLPEGEEGELVLTTLTKEAFPLIRFRTGDRTRLLAGECPCGRTGRRIARIASRTDDLLSVRGIEFYPSRIGELLSLVEGTRPRFRLVVEREEGVDTIEVRVEVSEEIFFDEMRKQRTLVDEIRARIRDELDLAVRVKLVEPRTLDAEGGTRVVDRRYGQEP